jgi:hypothetical protein
MNHALPTIAGAKHPHPSNQDDEQSGGRLARTE